MRHPALWTGALLIVAALVVILIVSELARSGSGGPTIDGIPCERGERLTYHLHTHLALFVEGEQIEVPPHIGIKGGCIYWLHTHDDSGIIHVEAPSQRQFTLGEFFSIWGQALSSTALLDRQADNEHQIQAFVNGQLFDGDPANIPLESHTVIAVEYGPPFPPPPPFQFPQGLPR